LEGKERRGQGKEGDRQESDKEEGREREKGKGRENGSGRGQVCPHSFSSRSASDNRRASNSKRFLSVCPSSALLYAHS